MRTTTNITANGIALLLLLKGQNNTLIKDKSRQIQTEL